MKKFLHIVALLIFTAITAAGESIVVIGQVLSADDASPLEAAHVWFKGTDIGTTTNEDGFFLLRSDEPQRTLEVSVVGYRTREIKLDYGKDQMVEVFMREQNNLIDEIIVIPGENPAIELWHSSGGSLPTYGTVHSRQRTPRTYCRFICMSVRLQRPYSPTALPPQSAQTVQTH